MRVLSFSAALFSAISLVAASKVVDLDDKNFEKIVGLDKPALVEFFAPWCGHCKNLAPVYEQLADVFDSDKVIIAKTDADGVGRALGSRFDVQGFPTLKWFPAGSLVPEEYSSGRDLDSLAAFVTQKSGVKSSIKPPPPPAAVQLESTNFDEIALNKDKDVLVAFTAPWCGHCKNMKPAYESVAKAFATESNCVLAQMNADDAKNKPIAERYDVRSYPTILFFPKGEDKKPIPYQSGRSEEQFVEFLNEHCGTSRSTGGLLSDTAGRILALDVFAQRFFAAPTKTDRRKIFTTFQTYLSTLTRGNEKEIREGAQYYVRAMDRIINKGERWVVKEQARLASLLASPSLAPSKLDEIKIKLNILGAFASQKAEEVVDAASDLAAGAAGIAKEGAAQVVENVESFLKQAEEKAKEVHSEL